MPADTTPRNASFPTPPRALAGPRTTTLPVPVVSRSIEALDLHAPAGRGALGARSSVLAALELAPVSRLRVDAPYRRVIPAPVATTPHWEAVKCKAVRFLDDLCKPQPGTFAGVRIALDSAPGHGHQGSGVGAYRQLRALGFTGPVQFMCRPLVSGKLRALLYGGEASTTSDTEPGAAEWLAEPNTSWAEWLSQGIIRNKQGYVERAPPCPLVIAGGMDIHPSKFFIEDINAERGICLQPVGWRMQRFVVHKNKRPETLDSKTCATQRQNLAVHGPFPQYDHYGHFVQSRLPAEQAQVFVTLRAAQDAGRIDTCCLYGRYDTDILPFLVGGVRRAQKRKNSRIKPTAILWFGAKSVDVKSLGVHASAVKTTSATAVQDIVDLAESKRRLIIFTCDRLPQDVCHDAFLKGTLPAALEGACSENLLRLAQKPYLKMVWKCRGDGPDEILNPLRLTDLSRSRLPAGRSDNKRFVDPGLRVGHEARFIIDDDGVKADCNKIARFIHQAAAPARVSIAYAALGGTSLLPSSDALLCGLDALRRGELAPHDGRKSP